MNTQTKNTVYLFGGTITDDKSEIERAIRFARAWAGSNEDDRTEPEAYVCLNENEGPTYGGKWLVLQDNRAQNPTDSEMVAGPFDTEEDALKACEAFNVGTEPKPDEIELPEGVELIHSECSWARGRYRDGYSASVMLKKDGKYFTGDDFTQSKFVRGSVESEYAATNAALEKALKKIADGEYDGMEKEEEEEETENA